MVKNLDSYLKYDAKNENVTIAVAMSGGVDSSTVAYMLKKQGYKVFGMTMRVWTSGSSCSTNIDLSDAKKVCDDLGIEHHMINLGDEFKNIVVDSFVNDYMEGRTPNPCMVCNRHIKFGRLVQSALSHGADFIATGHYAKIENGLLKIGDDPNKDQVYFLSQMRKENIKKLMFPIGELKKPRVRELAELLNIRVYAKKESQEICFVEDGKLGEFLNELTDGKATSEGDIVRTDGKVIGKHRGVSFYTIGQRKGLGISYPTPLYVIQIDSKKNRLVVGNNEELFSSYLIANKINLLGCEKIENLKNMKLKAKTRSRDKFHSCSIKVLENDKIKIDFIEEKVRAITPGQGVVLYNYDGEVMASGFIVK
ncbi:MAG: tRNA 2-thiouridine(34) synthase MnmA [Psychrilyobacter sp.]|uniref:tRNA 2-thiouridine(34) synthase MnmA n=1 Tax=Psychrilyobacter sp. TaxID=2586924 RepID=UPI003C754A45